MSPEIRANFEAIYHLDEPVYLQYVRYMVGDIVDTGKLSDFGRNGLLGGHLGPSYKYRGRTINNVLFDGGPVKAAISVSFQLGVFATIIAVGLGIPLGLISALRQNTWVDYTSMFFAMLFVSIPNFVLHESNMVDEHPLNDIVDQPLTLQDGYILVPHRSGIGVQIREEKLANYPYEPRPISANLRADGSVT